MAPQCIKEYYLVTVYLPDITLLHKTRHLNKKEKGKPFYGRAYPHPGG